MDRTLQTLVEGLAQRGDRPAVIAFAEDGRLEFSYRQLDESVGRLAAGLAARGIGVGSRVAVISPNSPSVIILRLALIAAGAMAVPLDELWGAPQVAHALADSGAGVLFTTAALAGSLNVDTLRAGCGGGLESVYLLEDAGTPEHASWRTLLADDAPASDRLPRSRPDDITSLIYTSGTTAAAKGVPLSHANFMLNIDALAGGGFIGPQDRILMPLPLHHSYPFMAGLMVPLASGATIVLPRGVTGPEIAEALRDAGVTAMIGVPRLYEAMAIGIRGRIAAAAPLQRALFGVLLSISTAARRRLGIRAGRALMRPVRARFAPALRLLASGGARLGDAAAWTLEGLGFEVLSGYGLVETASVTTYNRHGRGRIGTEGLPVDGAEIRIAEPDGDGIGEILVRGPHVFRGYHNDPAATREAFTPDGWFRTGDLGRIEPDGALVVVGRSKEVIVLSGGKNVGPEEVETALNASPYIAESAVLEQDGRLLALIVPDLAALRAAGTARLDELLRVAVTESCVGLAPYKRVTGFRIWRQPLPKTRLGKIQRFELPRLYAAAERMGARGETEVSAADRALLDNAAARRVFELLRQRFPDSAVDLDTSPQLDLGIDSLAWLELTEEIESAAGVPLSTDALAEIVTVRDILEIAAAQGTGAGVAPRTRPEPRLPDLPRANGPALRAVGFAIYWLNRVLMRCAFRLRVSGPVPDDGGPTLFVVNHASDLDPFVLAAALPWRIARRVWWSAEVTRVFDTPVRRWFARAGRIFPIDDRKPAESLARGEAALAMGDDLVWFPEAWRTPDGSLQPFMRGVGSIVNARRPRICPVWVEGTFEVLPRHRRWPRFRPVSVIFGPVVAAADAVPAAPATEDAATASAIRELVAALQPGHGGTAG